MSVFSHCNVCGIVLRTPREDSMGMCERCASEGGGVIDEGEAMSRLMFYKHLDWAFRQVKELCDTAAGVSCRFCDGQSPQGNISNVKHKASCPWLKCKKFLEKYKAA